MSSLFYFVSFCFYIKRIISICLYTDQYCVDLCRSGLRVNYGCLVPGGVPLSSYRGKDGQSDAEASHVLNPLYLDEDSWDNLGMHVFQLKASLTTGMWTASSGFQPAELLENAATGF